MKNFVLEIQKNDKNNMENVEEIIQINGECRYYCFCMNFDTIYIYSIKLIKIE